MTLYLVFMKIHLSRSASYQGESQCHSMLLRLFRHLPSWQKLTYLLYPLNDVEGFITSPGNFEGWRYIPMSIPSATFMLY